MPVISALQWFREIASDNICGADLCRDHTEHKCSSCNYSQTQANDSGREEKHSFEMNYLEGKMDLVWKENKMSS